MRCVFVYMKDRSRAHNSTALGTLSDVYYLSGDRCSTDNLRKPVQKVRTILTSGPDPIIKPSLVDL